MLKYYCLKEIEDFNPLRSLLSERQFSKGLLIFRVGVATIKGKRREVQGAC